MTILGYQNVNFGRPSAAHRTDFWRMRADGAEVIGLVELRERLRFEHWDENQPDRSDGSPGSEGIYVHTGIRVRFERGPFASLKTFGHAIGMRRILVSVIDDERIPEPYAFVLVHMPPKRMWGPLYEAYAYRLRRQLRSLNERNIPWVVAGDWNKLLSSDPAALHKTFNARWYGVRIDGFAVHPRLVKYVKKCTKWQNPNRNDGHPALYLHTGAVEKE